LGASDLVIVILIAIVIVAGVVVAVCVWYGGRLRLSAAAQGEQRREHARTVEDLQRRVREAEERAAKTVARIGELEVEVARLQALLPPPPRAETRAQGREDRPRPAPADGPAHTSGATDGWETFGDSPRTWSMLAEESDVSVVEVDLTVHDAPAGRSVVVTRTTAMPPGDVVDSL
jgi:hypothetical protein